MGDAMTVTTQSAQLADQQLATSLAKLWPHREHEAPSFSGVPCRLGLHHWRPLDTSEVAPQKHARFCLWCSVVKIDGQIYMP
jgi:hypothetical protein